MLIQITEYDIQSHKIEKEKTIAVLADLHDRPHEKVLKMTEEVAPDYILIAGDLAEKRVGMTENVLKCLRSCVKIAPTYYALGNHEMFYSDADIEEAGKTGAVILDNSWCYAGIHRDILIGGLTSTAVLRAREGKIRKAYKSDLDLSWLPEFENHREFKILMSHHPEDYFPFLKERNIDLILSGHAHGGQIRIFGRGVYAPNQGILPKYTEGMVDNRMIVSRGLSNTGGLMPRLFNPRELVVVKLCPENKLQSKVQIWNK